MKHCDHPRRYLTYKYRVTHPNAEKTVFDRQKSDKRMIFYADKVPQTGNEMSLMQRIEQEKSSLNLPIWWRTGDTLRFAHTVQLDFEKTKHVVLPHSANCRVPCIYPRGEKHKAKPGDSRFHRKR